MNTGAGSKCQAVVSKADVLILQALQVHFDTALRAVVERQMAHGIGIEAAIQFPVQMVQGIQVEGGSQSLRVIVGGMELLRGFLQVRANQQGATGSGQFPQPAQKAGSLGRFKVANGGAGEKTRRPSCCNPSGMAMAWQ